MFISTLNTAANEITHNHTPYNIQENYGFFHVYAFTMTIGMILAVLASYIKLKRKNVSAEPLIGSVFLIIPASLFGASFFGKLNAEGIGRNADGATWYECFYFWKGGMSIHGGVLFGVIVGLIYFYIIGRKLHVSLLTYTDAIIPNILIGQAIGRWGNFFNHELLGNVVSYESLKWLPGFIRDNCWQWVGNNPEIGSNGEIVYRAPIFLYESIGTVLSWLFITFATPNFGKIRRYKVYNEQKYNFKNNMRRVFLKKDIPRGVSLQEIWNNAYFEYRPTLKSIKNQNREKTVKKSWRRFLINDDSRYLSRIHNPKKLFITRCGVETGFYFAFYNFVRFIIETQRPDDHLFIMYDRTLDYTFILGFVFLGLVVSLLTQFWSPVKFRKMDWFYEKEYFNMNIMSNWNLTNSFQKNITLSNNSTTNAQKELTSILNSTLGESGSDEWFIVIPLLESDATLNFKFEIKPTEKCLIKYPEITPNYVMYSDNRINISKLIGMSTIQDEKDLEKTIFNLCKDTNNIAKYNNKNSLQLSETFLLKNQANITNLFKDNANITKKSNIIEISKFAIKNNDLFWISKKIKIKIRENKK